MIFQWLFGLSDAKKETITMVQHRGCLLPQIKKIFDTGNDIQNIQVC